MKWGVLINPCSLANEKVLMTCVSPPCSTDVYSTDSLSGSSQRDDHRVRVVVSVADLRVFKDVSPPPPLTHRLNLETELSEYPVCCVPTGGQAARLLRGNGPRERQDGLVHAGLGCQPGFQGAFVFLLGSRQSRDLAPMN